MRWGVPNPNRRFTPPTGAARALLTALILGIVAPNPAVAQEANIVSLRFDWPNGMRARVHSTPTGKESFSFQAFDAATKRVAEKMTFTPAYQRDEPVAVWIAQQREPKVE